MRFQALTEHQLLVLWVQLLVLLVTARGLGAAARRLGQPPVVGELLAGVLLGPSVLGLLAPGFWLWLFPADPVHAGLMAGIGWLGVFFLLVLAGYETDLALIRRLGRAAAWVSTGSLLLPLVFGFAVGIAMPGHFHGDAGNRWIYGLFMATALAISSLPVIAKVLAEALNLMRRDFAQLTLAAGMANDVVGWVLLGLIAGLAQSGTIDLGRVALSLGGLALLLGGAFGPGQRAVDHLLRHLRRRRSDLTSAVTAVILVALIGAATAQAIGLEGVLGAFIAGVVLGRSKFHDGEVFGVLESITLAFLAPIFFARAGLRVDLAALGDPTTLAWAGIVILAASLSKFGGALVGARMAGLDLRSGIALGAGLNARGALEIVVASVGLTMGILNQDSYTVVVVMAIATSMMAPILLRAIARGWTATPQEHERLQREHALSASTLLRPGRLLLPTHGGANSIAAAGLLDLAWPEHQDVTVLSIGPGVDPEAIASIRAAFTSRAVEHEHVADAPPLTAILEHARLGYGAIGVGATDRGVAGRLISPFVDGLLAASPIPVIMVRRVENAAASGWSRIVVPAIGTTAGRGALEIACGIARRVGTTVDVTHIVTTPGADVARSLLPWRRATQRPDSTRLVLGDHLLAEASRIAEEMGVRATTHVHQDVSAAEGLLAVARETRADLLVVTASVRRLSDRPFLGHGVEHLLERCTCTLVIVATPPGWEAGRG